MKALFPLVGYHGCSRDVAENVISGKEQLKFSSAKHEWLGDGIYFWENDSTRALEWALSRGIKEPYVIGAFIDPREVIDFSTRESIPLLQEASQILEDRFALAGLPLPENKPIAAGDKFYKNRMLDCLIMNTLAKPGRFDVFKAPFIEGENVYQGGTFRKETHVQLCVKNPGCIVGTFVPVKDLKTLGLKPL